MSTRSLIIKPDEVLLIRAAGAPGLVLRVGLDSSDDHVLVDLISERDPRARAERPGYVWGAVARRRLNDMETR